MAPFPCGPGVNLQNTSLTLTKPAVDCALDDHKITVVADWSHATPMRLYRRDAKRCRIDDWNSSPNLGHLTASIYPFQQAQAPLLNPLLFSWPYQPPHHRPGLL